MGVTAPCGDAVPAIQNVERRGAICYWRRTVRFQDGRFFTLCLSFRTTAQAVAQHGVRDDRDAEDDLGQGRPSLKSDDRPKGGSFPSGDGGHARSYEAGQRRLLAYRTRRDLLDREPRRNPRSDVQDFIVNGVSEDVGSRARVGALFRADGRAEER